MNSHTSWILLGATGVLSTVAPSAAAVDTSQWKCESCPFPKGTSGTLEAGLGAVSDASNKFGDFTGLQRRGVHGVLGGTLRQRGDDDTFADLSATDLGLDSRALAAQAGREGLYTLKLGYAEIPRHFADAARTPFLGGGSSVLTLPAGFAAGSTAGMPLASTLQPADLGFKWQRLDLGGSLIAGDNWIYRVSLRHDVRDGTRPTSGSSFASAAQLSTPVDQVTDQVEVSASYVSQGVQATLSYLVSQFRNGAQSLTWDNPFTPVVPGSTRGQLALAPDNGFQQVAGSAGYDIGPKIRLSADFALGRMSQDAAYQASTLNATLAPAALPTASLDGRVDTFNGSVKLTAAPIDGLRLNASYDRNVRDDRTAINAYSIVVTDMFVDPVLRNNTPFSHWQDRFRLGADYRASAAVKLSAGVEQDDRQRSYTEAVKTHETTFWGRMTMQPLDTLSVAAKLAHAERTHSPYGTAVWFSLPENPLLRKFNIASRTRDSGSLRGDLTLNEKVGLGLALDFASDDYDESTIGLKDARSAGIAVDLAFAVSEATQLTVFAQAERSRSRQAGSQVSAAPDWTGRVEDRFQMLGLGIKHAAIPDKLDIGADLMRARSSSNVEVEAGTNDPPFPAARTSLGSMKLYATYKLKDNLWLNGSYWYESYDTRDWRLDGVLPDAVFNLLAFGQTAPHYHVNVVRLSLRYRF
jgi:MtrB/PioB family decaheme-associated outer membrane protein